MSSTKPNRVLAVEIRAARLGYAVFEAPKQLRDFGAASFPSARAARPRFARLLRLYQPLVLVLHGAGFRYPRDMKVRKALARIARDEARKVAIPVAFVSERAFKQFFKGHACKDKYDIAAVLAGWFPDLAWRVPPALDFYDSEPSQMLYFDSIALGVAYLGLNSKREQQDAGSENPFAGLQVT